MEVKKDEPELGTENPTWLPSVPITCLIYRT